MLKCGEYSFLCFYDQDQKAGHIENFHGKGFFI